MESGTDGCRLLLSQDGTRRLAPLPGTRSTPDKATGADGCQDDRHPSDLEARALAALRRPAGVLVFDLSRELGLEIRVTEGLLRSLRGRGLATAAQEGTPPITTWRATR